MKKRWPVLIMFLALSAALTSASRIGARESFPEVETHDPYFEDSRERRELTLDEFVRLAAKNDDQFELILIDELELKYRKAIGLPAADLVASVKNEYNYFRRQSRGDRAMSVSLSKLFPKIGTEIEASYDTEPGFSRRQNSSSMTLMISQPIAENAFGRATRLRDNIIGLEIDVALHQIVEAYEDYLATIIKAYLAWYEAYENYKVGDSSYRANLKLQENMEERMKSNIALPIDVNKITLQVLAKKETLIDLRTAYDNALNLIEDAISHDGAEVLVPVMPKEYSDLLIQFERDYEHFRSNSRTYEVLRLLEERSSLSVKEEFDDLFPSIDLQIGTTWDWNGFEAEREDQMYFAAFTFDWGFFEQVDKAEYETAKIARDKAKLTTMNTIEQLYVNLKNISQQVDAQRELLLIAEEKISRAHAVLEDETENYSFGKVTLNDYIDAVNVYDNNRFNQVRRDVLLSTLIVEWLRLSDQLIDRPSDILDN